MSKSKMYYSSISEKNLKFEIYWEKSPYTTKKYQELTISYNGINHSHDINDMSRYTINSMAKSYIRNVTFDNYTINDTDFMNKFIEILTPIIEEFQKDVEYEYSFDGWIGKIFIEPFENFVDWLKK
jgi:hypothetical protein